MFCPSITGIQVSLCLEHQDFRKGVRGLCLVVQNTLLQNPMSGQLFVFRNKGRSQVKILFWKRNGISIDYKDANKRPCQQVALKNGW